jgi:hypothetical protein
MQIAKKAKCGNLPGAKLHQIKVGKGFGRVQWKRLANCYD